MFPFVLVSLNPFVWLGDLMSAALKILNSVTGNWGIAIILFTLIIRILLQPLNKKSMDSMKAMQELQPEMEKLKKKYKDQQELQMKTMELYKEKGINPAAGCLPMLLQMPILFALFASIRGLSVELESAQFLWLDSLTKTGDLALIILTGLVTFAQSYLQQKMTANNGAGNQTAMMTYMMPILIIMISRSLPAGLLLYWFTSTLVMTIQQLLNYQGRPALKGEGE